MIFPIMKHFENPIHTVLIFITTAVFNSTVLGSQKFKIANTKKHLLYDISNVFSKLFSTDFIIKFLQEFLFSFSYISKPQFLLWSVQRLPNK